MAVEKTRFAAEVTTEERTRAVEIRCETHMQPAQWQVVWLRETVTRLGNGVSVGAPVHARQVDRVFSQIAKDSVTLDDGTNLTVSQIAEAIKKLGDTYAEQDMLAEVQGINRSRSLS